MKQKTIAQLLLLAVVAVWGATFALVKGALSDCPPLLFNLLRMTIAAATLWMINQRRLRGLRRRTVVAGAVAGLLLAAGYQFQTLGLTRTTSAKSALLTGLVVVFVPLLTLFPVLRPKGAPRPRWTAAIGVPLAFSGLLLLTTPPGTTLSTMTTEIGVGDWLTLLCALAFAGHLLSLAHLAPEIPTAQLATLQISFAAAFMLLSLPLSKSLRFHVTSRLLIALAITSLLATAAAFTIQSWAQQHIPPANTAVLLTMEPVFALAVSILLLGEPMSRRSIAGAILILGGIATMELLALPHPIPIDPA